MQGRKPVDRTLCGDEKNKMSFLKKILLIISVLGIKKMSKGSNSHGFFENPMFF